MAIKRCPHGKIASMCYICGADEARTRLNKLEADLETLRMRLAACSVVALANSPKSAANARNMHDNYKSASLDDVIRAVDREMKLRADNKMLLSVLEEIASDVDGSWQQGIADRAIKGLSLND